MAKRSRSSSSSIDPFDRRYLAEFVGTLILVLVGCGSIAITGLSGNAGGALSIGLAFGVTLTALIYSIGVISGGHFNPAVIGRHGCRRPHEKSKTCPAISSGRCSAALSGPASWF